MHPVTMATVLNTQLFLFFLYVSDSGTYGNHSVTHSHNQGCDSCGIIYDDCQVINHISLSRPNLCHTVLRAVTFSKIPGGSVFVHGWPKPFGGQHYRQLGNKLPFVWNLITSLTNILLLMKDL